MFWEFKDGDNEIWSIDPGDAEVVFSKCATMSGLPLFDGSSGSRELVFYRLNEKKSVLKYKDLICWVRFDIQSNCKNLIWGLDLHRPNEASERNTSSKAGIEHLECEYVHWFSDCCIVIERKYSKGNL